MAASLPRPGESDSQGDNGPGDLKTARISLEILGRKIDAEIPAPVGLTPVSDFLPMFRSMTDLVVGIAAEDAAGAGHPISCHKGCGACCRQLVPLTEPEARGIADLVESIPEPRRSNVRARFRDARDRFEEAGIGEKLRTFASTSYEDRMALGLDYFHLGVACPFLEEESCSIHSDRPMRCREYIVTSPPEHCADPSAENVRLVGLAAQVSVAVAHLGATPDSDKLRWVPLIQALEWAETHPVEAPTQTGTQLVEAFFSRLIQREIVPSPHDQG